MLEFIPDWFVTPKMLDDLGDGEDFNNDEELVKWFNGDKQQNAWKKQIKEEFLPITWYDWSIQENEKKRDKEMLALIKRGYLCRFGEYHIAVFAI